MELRSTSKKILLNYINESPQASLIERARDAIGRYLQEDIPSLEEVRAKADSGMRLDRIDHKILQLEYEARRFSDQYHRSS